MDDPIPEKDQQTITIREETGAPTPIKKPERKPRGKRRKRVAVRSKPTTEKKELAPKKSDIPEVVAYEKSSIAEIVKDADDYTEDEINQIVLGLEDQGNKYDFVRNMDDFAWPPEIQRLEDAAQKHYRWIDTTDPQTFDMQLNRPRFRFVPVNRTNHPDVPKKYFNKHGGMMRGGMLACFMPWKIYEAWNEEKSKRANAWTEKEESKYGEKTEVGEFYDPRKEGGAGIEKGSRGFVAEAEDTHPESLHIEQGEYTA